MFRVLALRALNFLLSDPDANFHDLIGLFFCHRPDHIFPLYLIAHYRCAANHSGYQVSQRLLDIGLFIQIDAVNFRDARCDGTPASASW